MARGFSENLSTLRKERGLNQRRAAAELKISQALLSHYENGIREPGLDFVNRVCEYYGVSADYMLGRTDMRETVLPLEAERSAALDKTTQDAAVLTAALFKLLPQCGDEAATAALRYLATSEYRLLRRIFSGTESGVFALSEDKALALCEADMQLLSLQVCEALKSRGGRPAGDSLRKGVSKVSYKTLESLISKTEERLGAMINTKTDGK